MRRAPSWGWRPEERGDDVHRTPCAVRPAPGLGRDGGRCACARRGHTPGHGLYRRRARMVVAPGGRGLGAPGGAAAPARPGPGRPHRHHPAQPNRVAADVFRGRADWRRRGWPERALPRDGAGLHARGRSRQGGVGASAVRGLRLRGLLRAPARAVSAAGARLVSRRYGGAARRGRLPQPAAAGRRPGAGGDGLARRPADGHLHLRHYGPAQGGGADAPLAAGLGLGAMHAHPDGSGRPAAAGHAVQPRGWHHLRHPGHAAGRRHVRAGTRLSSRHGAGDGAPAPAYACWWACRPC